MVHFIWFLLALGLGLLAAVLWQRERRHRVYLERKGRRQSQELLSGMGQVEQAHEQLLAAVSSSSHPLIVVDRVLDVHFANRYACERFGRFQPGMSLISFARAAALEQLARDAWEIGADGDLERTLRIDDRPFLVRAKASGEYVGLSLEDISEVQRLSRARQDMIANLSHELRTPIASIRLLAETLLSPAGESPEVADNLIRKTVSEVEVLEQITQEMLDLSSIESGQQVIRLVPVGISVILANPLARLEEQAARKSIEIKVKNAGGLQILADRTLAERAVLNVLQNAIKFSAKDSEVSISAKAADESGMVRLSIQDCGPGIHPDDLSRIFERFYRTDRARSTPGTGLGLSIAHHIMRSHGGSIHAENRQPPDTGAIFHLSFRAA
jgi:two-component system phosphate regulon sensor histidine kinase PhoR